MNNISEIYSLVEKFDFNISTDTRTHLKGSVFFALKGENFDGNKFINEAIKKGASAVVTTAGTYKVCVYTEDGSSKVIDVTSGTTASGVNNITVSPAVILNPGNYYVAMGCATTCSNTITSLSNISILHLNGASVPSGKLEYGGTVSHTSGTCNSTLGTVTAATTAIPLIRFDN
jgi:hypothetical protein